MTDSETKAGTLDNSTITALGDDAIVITAVDGNETTTDSGTTTTVEIAQVDGTATEAGTKTNDD